MTETLRTSRPEAIEVLQVKMSQRKVVNTMYVCFKTPW